MTGNAFGVLKYLPAHDGILGFLRIVPGLNDLISSDDTSAICAFHFWPLVQKMGREPDLLVAINDGRQSYHLVVEAKFWSRPSDNEDQVVIVDGSPVTAGNQLADEYRDLLYGHYYVFENGVRGRYLRLDSRPEDRFLLYLTNDATRPDYALDRALVYEPGLTGNLYWANWDDMCDYVVGLSREARWHSDPAGRMIDDLAALLIAKGFGGFHGISRPPDLLIPPLAWKFTMTWPPAATAIPDGGTVP